mgnify:CR=1 FL=1
MAHRLSGGAPLLPGWQEGAERIPKITVIVRRLHLDLQEAVPRTVPTTQKGENKPIVKLARSAAAGEQENISVDLAEGEQEVISVDRDPCLWHPALENMDVADFQEDQP